VSEEYGVSPNQIIDGKFRLIEPIGKGGMGSVWRAEQLDRNAQLVALKIILPKRLDSAPKLRRIAIGRFMREAQAMTRLKSPHVVHVFDHGSDGEEIVYIAMELMHGESLAQRLKRSKRLTRENTVRLMTHVGRAIHLAHKEGIVHRDLKPANIFLCALPGSGHRFVGKVLDFGLAKSMSEPLLTEDPFATRTGALLGTPFYMSPEQARASGAVDHRSDLWSMAVITFECLCGRKPFRSRGIGKLFAQIAAGKPPVPSALVDVPTSFDGWFAHALQRDPKRRFQSAQVMVDELQEVLGETITVAARGAATRAAATMGRKAQRPAGQQTDKPTLVPQDAFGLRTHRIERRGIGASFVGRAAEVAAQAQKLSATVRLLTLAGPRGIGKTRLARRILDECGASPSRPSLWYAWLGSAQNPPWWWLEIATALDIVVLDADPIPQLGRALRALGPAIILLDDVDAARTDLATAIPRWLELAPEARFVLTAEEPLGIGQEETAWVHPLDSPIASISDISQLRQHSAAALFLTRAVSVDRKLLGADHRAPEIARLVTRLGGMSAAIELVAHFVDRVPLETMAQGLSEMMRSPKGTTIIDPEETMRAALAWTWNQLDAVQRSVLIQCSAFRGSFTLEAVEVVVDLAAWPYAPNPYQVVATLASQGLLGRDEPMVGEERYEIPPLLRLFCQNWLREMVSTKGTDGPISDWETVAVEATRRHGRYFAQLGDEKLLETVRCRGGLMQRLRLEREIYNLVVALDRAVVQQEASLAVALARAVAVSLSLRGQHATAAAAIVPVLTIPGCPPRELVLARLTQGEALLRCGNYATAANILQSALSLACDCADPPLECLALLAMGHANLEFGELGRAQACFANARAQCSEAGDQRGLALALNGLGRICILRGAERDGRAALEQAIAIHQQLGNRQHEAESLSWLAKLCIEHELLDHGQRHLAQALQLHRELGNRHVETELLGLLGQLQLRVGETQQAREHLEQAALRASELGSARLQGRALSELAVLFAQSGATPRALDAMAKAEQLLAADNSSLCLGLLACRRAQLEMANSLCAQRSSSTAC